MGIGTLRQYHNRQSNLTTIEDITEEVTEKTAFVEATPTKVVDVMSKTVIEKTSPVIEVTKTDNDIQRFDNESPAVTSKTDNKPFVKKDHTKKNV